MVEREGRPGDARQTDSQARKVNVSKRLERIPLTIAETSAILRLLDGLLETPDDLTDEERAVHVELRRKLWSVRASQRGNEGLGVRRAGSPDPWLTPRGRTRRRIVGDRSQRAKTRRAKKK
jgi:hypothetical protein